MKQIIYSDDQLYKMTEEQINKLGMLCPKKVFCQLETSGSPSVWTDYGEWFAGNKGADVVKCAKEIRKKVNETIEHNEAFKCGLNNFWSCEGHVRVLF